MANFPGRDKNGTDAYLKATGTGTNPDPYVIERANAVLTDVHDDVNHLLGVRQVALTGDTDSVTKQGSINEQIVTITTGGAAQQAVAANVARRYLCFQNTSDTVMWLRPGGPTDATAASPSRRLNVLGSVGDTIVFDGSFVPTDGFSVMCATTGKTLTVWEGDE